jgi:hypothetical protein
MPIMSQTAYIQHITQGEPKMVQDGEHLLRAGLFSSALIPLLAVTLTPFAQAVPFILGLFAWCALCVVIGVLLMAIGKPLMTQEELDRVWQDPVMQAGHKSTSRGYTTNEKPDHR